MKNGRFINIDIPNSFHNKISGLKQQKNKISLPKLYHSYYQHYELFLSSNCLVCFLAMGRFCIAQKLGGSSFCLYHCSIK